MVAVRSLTVWCPDWPVVAAGRSGEPVAVLAAGRVVACSAPARGHGVRAGLRLREAQSRCPGLRVVDCDEARDMRAFEPVVAALAAVCPRVEIVRPGLLLFPTKGPARYFGGESKLALVARTTVADVLGDEGSCYVGVADGAFASRLAARAATHPVTQAAAGPDAPVDALIVPPGGSAGFLAPFPVAVLDRPELADLLVRLGVRTLGDLAALPHGQVAARFGAEGAVAHRLARGLDERPPAVTVPPAELAVSAELDPPADRVETAAFVAKSLADRLHDTLGERGLACTRVLVEAETEHGEQLSRLWRHDGALTAAAIAERVRWQLGGWLTGDAADRPTAGILRLRLEPDDVHADVGRQLGLWGGATLVDERAARAFARLQGLLGHQAVVTAVPAGGRGPAEQAALIPWGDPRPALYAGDPPWPGAVPAPSPATVHDESVPAAVVDADGAAVVVDGRSNTSAAPAHVAVAGGPALAVVGWAGPWPVDERWWDAAAHRRRARFQVVTADGTARLLSVEGGRWWVEATYD